MRKAVADLDELAAGDEHVAAARQRGEGEQHRGGVVVHDQRVLGAGERAEDVVDVVLARGALPALEAELEVGVAGRGTDERRYGFIGQDRAPQVGVHDDAAGVDHAAQRRGGGEGKDPLDPGNEVGRDERLGAGRRRAVEDVAPQALDDGACGVDDEVAPVQLEQPLDARLAQHLVDGGESAQALLPRVGVVLPRRSAAPVIGLSACHAHRRKLTAPRGSRGKRPHAGCAV